MKSALSMKIGPKAPNSVHFDLLRIGRVSSNKLSEVWPYTNEDSEKRTGRGMAVGECQWQQGRETAGERETLTVTTRQ